MSRTLDPPAPITVASDPTDIPLETIARFPPYPRTERQAHVIAIGERLGRIAAAQADAHDKANTFPHDTFAALREAGYLALTVPEAYGGFGASPLEAMLAQERLAAGSGSVGLGVAMQFAAVAGVASSSAWPDALRHRILRDVVERGALINGLASEPELGSPSRGGGFRTVARRDGDTGLWVIDGRKTWSTLSPALAWGNVLLTIREADGTESRGQFCVPMDTPGVRIEETWDNLAMRASGSHDVVFDRVIVPDDYRLPPPKGLPASQVTGWNLLTSAVYLGVAQAARDYAVRFAQERVPTGLGRPIATLETVQHRIARIDILLLQARSVLYGTIEAWESARTPDERERIAWQFAAAKVTVTNHAIEVTDQALRVVGSVGLKRSEPLERYFRDVLAGLGNPPM
ncbi:MAG: acyl-CoA dehydrogenase family protein, partial [Thermomicrobiales bacterium]